MKIAVYIFSLPLVLFSVFDRLNFRIKSQAIHFDSIHNLKICIFAFGCFSTHSFSQFSWSRLKSNVIDVQVHVDGCKCFAATISCDCSILRHVFVRGRRNCLYIYAYVIALHLPFSFPPLSIHRLRSCSPTGQTCLVCHYLCAASDRCSWLTLVDVICHNKKVSAISLLCNQILMEPMCVCE